jgi:succinate-semialdehyde dehydrogenase/glutarate-semialdehyde dehydrogenase
MLKRKDVPKPMQKNIWLHEANYVGGQWVEADSSAAITVTNPATGEKIGSIPDCGAKGANAAIEAAHKAFPAWSALTAQDRAKLLFKLADLLRNNADELANLLTLEQGKPLAEAKTEVLGSAAYTQWYAEEAKRIYGDTIPSPWNDRRIIVVKQPVGVVAAITPWNFPSSMIARKVGAALAAGCTAVVKPSEATPYSGLAWGALAEAAGIPAGVLNIITGKAPPIGEAFCNHPLVAKITFTGSTVIGKKLASAAIANMKHVTMELGGHAPLIVFDDADLERAVAGAVASKFRNAGQTCVCANRIYVQAKIYDKYADAFTAAVKRLKVGNGFDRDVNVGPLINEEAVDKVARQVEDAVSKGAKVLTGGRQPASGGLFYEPTVLSHANHTMMIAHEETFGPVAPLFRFEKSEDAIAMANDSDYGLAAYFYTRDLARAFEVAEKLQYGQVGVNEAVITTEVAPFGGVKDSGIGREGSKYGIDDYVNIKYLCLGL